MLLLLRKKANVKFVVYSSLPNVEAETAGGSDSKRPTKLHVPHFTGKGIGNDAFAKAGVPFCTLEFAFYFQNWNGFFPPSYDATKKTATYSFPLKVKMMAVDVNDGGKAVHAILVDAITNPTAWAKGKDGKSTYRRIGLVGEFDTFKNMVATSGVKNVVVDDDLKLSDFKAFLESGPFKAAAQDLHDMFVYFEHYGFFADNKNVELFTSLGLGVKLNSFSDYVQVSKFDPAKTCAEKIEADQKAKDEQESTDKAKAAAAKKSATEA